MQSPTGQQKFQEEGLIARRYGQSPALKHVNLTCFKVIFLRSLPTISANSVYGTITKISLDNLSKWHFCKKRQKGLGLS